MTALKQIQREHIAKLIKRISGDWSFLEHPDREYALDKLEQIQDDLQCIGNYDLDYSCNERIKFLCTGLAYHADECYADYSDFESSIVDNILGELEELICN